MQTNPPLILQFIPIIFILSIFYFFIILPSKKKQKEFKEMIDNLKKNDEIVTIGGIHGTIINIKERTFIIRIDDNTKIEIDKNAISYVKKERK